MTWGGGRKCYVRLSPPSPFWARKRAFSRSSSKSSSFTSPGLKTLPASNSSFFSLFFFRFCGRGSTCCCDMSFLQFRRVGIVQVDSPPAGVVDDQQAPINHFDIEPIAQVASECSTRILRRLLNRSEDRVVRRHAVHEALALSPVEEKTLLSDFRFARPSSVSSRSRSARRSRSVSTIVSIFSR